MIQTVPPQPGKPMGFAEFVALVASLFALGALGIDAMLPALPELGRSLGVADPNARQYVITAFLGGFGVAQLIHGPLADRYGRRSVLLWSMALYGIANIAAATSGSFALLLAARAIGGGAVAATRVATVAMIRDRYDGAAMSRVMSIAFIVFMIVPIAAPAIGQAVLLVADWRAIFWGIAGLSVAIWTWFYLRMPETLAADRVQPISARHILDGWRRTMSDRLSLGYTLASTALMGGMYGYLNSIGQVVGDTFSRPDLLAAVFATTAGAMAAANLFNARLVMRMGTRTISHGAMVAMVVIAGLHLAVVEGGPEGVWTFVALQAMTLACIGLANSNFSAMAMTNMGPIAGTASSVQGFVSVTGGSIIGAIVGQAFDGSAAPLAGGFLFAGAAGLVAVAVTERGRLFGRGGTSDTGAGFGRQAEDSSPPVMERK